VNSPRYNIPEDFVRQVLERTDIVDVVGGAVTLKKGGANLLGLCPFHGEKSPSFTVSPSKQFFHCFGCGAHGDAIGFQMQHAGLSFVEAVKDLAQQAGLKLPEAPRDPAEMARAEAAQTRRRGIHELLERAAEHYRQQLKQSPKAVEYLKKRGLSGAVARDFGLGYAPEQWRGLASAFGDYADPLLVEAGLVIVQGDDEATQRRYDRFRDRIMFPIRSTRGDVIGFGGRVLDQGEPKYLNSPETPVFVKGHELYGLFEARSGLREQGYALVVEGYMDVVALAQSGLRHAVATLGTACTTDHVRKLLRFTDHVVFSFDGDAAGRRAASRALEAALPEATDLRSFRFLFLPPEHDPDSFVRAEGPQAFERAVAQAMPLSRMLLARAGEEADLTTAEGRARLLAQARPLWQAIPAGALRSQILAEIAQTARMDVPQLSQLWAEPSDARRRASGRPPGADGPSRSADHQRAWADADASPAEHWDGGDGGWSEAQAWSGASGRDRAGGSLSRTRMGAGRPPGPGNKPAWRGNRGARADRRPPAPRLAVRTPQDHAVQLLLRHNGLWEQLTPPDHELLAEQPGWHGEVFRWLERDLQEHGAAAWPELRERMANQAFEAQARSLIDGSDICEEPTLENLRVLIQHIVKAPQQRKASEILAKLGRPGVSHPEPDLEE
jgi:DNA primase